MLRILGYGVLGIVVILLILVFVAWRAPALPKQEDAFASLPASQREALTTLCAQAGISVSDLRLIFDSKGSLFEHEANRRAIVIENGQLTGLSLQHLNAIQHIDVRAWPQLRAMDLRNTGLSQWEALSGLAALKGLEYLNLSGTTLGTPPAAALPQSLKHLSLARTPLQNVQSLSHLNHLKHLNLSGTRLTSFEDLLGLSLQEIDLSHTPLQALPTQLPTQGDWKLKLEGTPVTQPKGYSATWPFETTVPSTPRQGDSAKGDIGQGRLDIQGELQPVQKTIAIPLPRTTDANLANAEIEVSIDAGHARIWLEEPSTLFRSPWFTEGKVEGFGSLRRRGYVFVEVKPGQTATLQGQLRLTSESRYYDRAPENRNETNRLPDWMDYRFFVEPLNSQTVAGLRYRIRHVPVPPLPQSSLKPQ